MSHNSALSQMAQTNWAWAGHSANTPSDSTSPFASSPMVTGKSTDIDGSTLFFQHNDKVLIVDGEPLLRAVLTPDMADSRRYMRTIFEPFCDVIEASDGQEALQKFDEGSPPDLIVADIMLPKVSSIYAGGAETYRSTASSS